MGDKYVRQSLEDCLFQYEIITITAMCELSASSQSTSASVN